ncbi:MAG: hypothetical protein K5866_02805 [Treponema sp.]|nr:hypothetical protein [Treponema sp.]
MKKFLLTLLMISSIGFLFAQEVEEVSVSDDSEVVEVNETSSEEATLESDSTSEKKVKIGGGLVPGLTGLGLCNYFIKPGSTLGGQANISTEHYKGGLGTSLSLNFSDRTFLSADTNHSFTSRYFDFATFESFAFNYKEKFAYEEFYTASVAKVKPFAEDSFLKSIYTTFEYVGDDTFKPLAVMYALGLETYLRSENESYLLVEPYVFIEGYDFSDTNFGPGLDIRSSLILFKHLGLLQNISTRYVPVNFNSNNERTSALHNEDYYRGPRAEQIGAAPLIFSGATEIFFDSPYWNINIFNFVELQKIHTGAFIDYAYNNTMAFCAGPFLRLKVSILGGGPFWAEFAGGYNQAYSKGFFTFGIKTVY